MRTQLRPHHFHPRTLLLAFAERAEPELVGRDQHEWQGRLEEEHDNLRSALQWSAEHEGGLRLAGALWRFWFKRPPAPDGGDSYITHGGV